MDALTLAGTALALSMDAFAVALAIAVRAGRAPGQVFRLSWHFGLFQAAMPVIGWRLGTGISAVIGTWGSWIACGILCLLGGKMIQESFRGGRIVRDFDPTRGLSLIGLSVATSLDALAVGVSLALLNVSVWLPAALIGAVAFALTATGMFLGRRAGEKLGPWAERIGGIALIVIGLKLAFLK